LGPKTGERIASLRVNASEAKAGTEEDAMPRCDVLVVGAGPTGLVLALWLTKFGVRVRIVDKIAEPGTTSRALAVHARTLELYRQLDLAETVVARGHKVLAVNLWVGGGKRASISFENIGAGVTPFPFLHIFPQDEHEKLLIEKLASLGVSVERRTECVGVDVRNDRVVARLRRRDGGEEVCEAAYLAGCDGAHSFVRRSLDLGFPGGEYSQTFYVADVEASGPPMDGQLHIDLDQADFLAVFPLAGKNRARLVGAVRMEKAAPPEDVQFGDVSARAIENLKISVGRVNWFSHYRVHHRVAQHFRKGRAFLLGDAAHIHSPAGGQGMNTGIGDAINLAWKLRAAMAGLAPVEILDSYEPERIAFARRLVATTDRLFTLASSESRTAGFLRKRIVPALLPMIAKSETVRKSLFGAISQINITYRASALNAGSVGGVHGGDRLPFVAAVDNHKPLSRMCWQVHVYGAAPESLREWTRQYSLPLHVYEWRDEYQQAGLTRDALYLLRPDSYIALASPIASYDVLARYLTARRIRF
jgi:2-polyprenyl-6-methoxyphenol hydroxylase-like FAD-dependent oxidoreductase